MLKDLLLIISPNLLLFASKNRNKKTGAICYGHIQADL